MQFVSTGFLWHSHHTLLLWCSYSGKNSFKNGKTSFPNKFSLVLFRWECSPYIKLHQAESKQWAKEMAFSLVHCTVHTRISWCRLGVCMGGCWDQLCDINQSLKVNTMNRQYNPSPLKKRYARRWICEWILWQIRFCIPGRRLFLVVIILEASCSQNKPFVGWCIMNTSCSANRYWVRRCSSVGFRI